MRIECGVNTAGRSACATLLLAFALSGAVPVLEELSPRGAQRGKPFTLFLRGQGFSQTAQIRTTLPATFSRLTRSKEAEADSKFPSVLPYLVTLQAATPTGIYPIRLTTPDGISNVLLFAVGDLPEIEEDENRKVPQTLPVPVTVSGELKTVDPDNYSFHAQAGQKLVFEVEARRIGSAIDPAVEIFDASGRLLAKNDDAPGLGVDSRVEVTFPKTGEYRVQVHDSKYSAQAANFYRLKIGTWRYAEAVFPLGGRRGETVDVTLSGGNLAAPEHVKIAIPKDAPVVPVYVPGSPELPFLLTAGDAPEVLEPGALHEDNVVNGRISKPGEIDRYFMAVEPGQKWVFEAAAASLGTSSLDAILTLRDSAGKKLASADDGNGLDPVLAFTIPKDVHEISLSVEDLLRRGGDAYGYRLQARRQPPDFVAELLTPFVNVPAGGTAQIPVLIQRRGYDGEIRLRIPNLPAGFRVAGGHIPSEAAAQNFNNDNAGRRTARSVLTITADAGAKTPPAELTVWAEADTPDGVLRRQARGPGLITPVRGDKQRAFSAPFLGMSLPIAVSPALPMTLTIPTPLVRFAQGFEYPLDYQLKRTGMTKPPAKVTQQIAGAVGNLRILKGTEKAGGDNGSVTVNTNFATPVTTFDMLLEAETVIDGKPVRISSPAVEIQVVPGYELKLDKAEIDVRPGGTVQLTGRVRREPTFEGGVVKVQVEDLPDGFTCPPVEVPADKSAFSIACNASAKAMPGAFEVRIASAAPNTGRNTKQEYKIADVNAKVVVAPATPAAVAQNALQNNPKDLK